MAGISRLKALGFERLNSRTFVYKKDGEVISKAEVNEYGVIKRVEGASLPRGF